MTYSHFMPILGHAALSSAPGQTQVSPSGSITSDGAVSVSSVSVEEDGITSFCSSSAGRSRTEEQGLAFHCQVWRSAGLRERKEVRLPCS